MKISPRFRVLLRRYVLFPLLPVAALVIVLTLVLGGLEKADVIDTERPDDLVAYKPINFAPVKEENGRKLVRIDEPTMVPETFSLKPEPGVMRIVVTGGSFAMGWPYAVQGRERRGGDLPSWLEVLLKAGWPQRKFEVINAAAGAQNSFRVKHVVHAALQWSPDVLVVMVGNNEGYVPPTSWNEILHEWTFYRAMKKALLPDVAPEKRPMYPAIGVGMKTIRAQFQRNMRDIVTMSRDAQVPIVVATVPINLRYFPTAEEYLPPDKPWYAEGRRLQESGRYEEAIRKYIGGDLRGYGLRLSGQCYEALEQWNRARAAYRAGVEYLPFSQTRPSFNEFVRELADDLDLPLVDLERDFEKQSPHGITGDRWFIDGCHLDWRGYYFTARRVLAALEVADLVTGRRTGELPEAEDYAVSHDLIDYMETTQPARLP
ncbi:MAG: hypothetical protein P9L99_09665 [Candidatus Lernaella stagnicola]|nr:hypothetical protein [Candidatus Lernaella stagnicola]